MTKHFTSTIYITAKIDGTKKVLLHFHTKLRTWLGIGGHVEENENPIEAAEREVLEETGLTVVISSKKKLFMETYAREIPLPEMVLEAHVPAYNGTEAHTHIDFAYFAVTLTPEDVKMNEQFGWFSEEQLQQSDILEEVRVLGNRAIKYHGEL